MFWVGLIFTIIAILGFLFKTFVIWNVSRDLYNGGGGPTMDYVIFYPPFIAVGISMLLHSLDAVPFPFFGLALFGAMLALSISVFWLFDRLGKPVRDAQLRNIQNPPQADEFL